MTLTRRDLFEKSAGLATLLAATAGGMSISLAQEGEEIRFGTLCPITRAGSIFGSGMQKGIELAAEDVNALGGILGGRKIKLFSEDSQSDPDAGVRAAKKLIEVNHVQTLLGTWSSGVTMAIAPICIESKVVNMNFSGTTELRDMKKEDYVWPVAGSNIAYGKMMGEYAVKQGYKKAAFMAFNNPSGLTLGDEFKKVFEAAGGTCDIVVYNPNQPSYRAELSKALANKPEVIALGSYLPDTTIILKEWYALGEDTKWIGPIWAVSPALIEAIGAEAAENVVSIGAVPNENSPAYASFRDRYEAATGQKVLANPFAAMAYDMLAACALAAELAKSAKAEDFRLKIRDVCSPEGKKVYSIKDALEAIRAGEDIDYEGVGGNMNFDLTGEAQPFFGAWVAEGGKLVFKGRIEV